MSFKTANKTAVLFFSTSAMGEGLALAIIPDLELNKMRVLFNIGGHKVGSAVSKRYLNRDTGLVQESK